MLHIFGKNSCQISQNITAAIISLQWFPSDSPAKKPHTSTQVSSNFDIGNMHLKVFRLKKKTRTHKTTLCHHKSKIEGRLRSMQWAPLSTHRSKVRVSTGHSVRSGLSTGNVWHFGSLDMNLPSRRTVVYHLTEKK